MPSLRMRAWSVVRFVSRRTAAPFGPPMRHCVCFKARRMCWRSASSRVEIEEVVVAAEFLHEVADQERDVFGALAESWDLDGENVQAVVKVAAKGAFGDALRKIGVGGGDDTNIHALSAVAAQPLEFLLLKHAKKFRLKFEGKVADFVEEE